MAGNREKDPITGQYTTGHEWDGIQELNTPLPKWWVWVFMVCIIWSIGYVVMFPAIPTGSTASQGLLGWHARSELTEELAEAKEAMGVQLAGIENKTVQEIAADEDLRNFAIRGGEVAFKENCAACHQVGGAGLAGVYPVLVDDEWIWGGSLDAIQTTLLHGIRSNVDYDTRISGMPRFGVDELLTKEEISTVADFVLAVSKGQGDSASEEAQELFIDNCAACHSSDGESLTADGNRDFGAPALNNGIWLYVKGNDDATQKAGIVAQVTNPKHSVMPAWGGRLDETTIKQLTVYVHSLGGGE
jgi:cytochrome c oxidase cbb3-type subunit 3